MEADWSRNVHIRDNYVEASYGGIFAGLIRQRDLGSGEYLNHKDIMITGVLHCNWDLMIYCKSLLRITGNEAKVTRLQMLARWTCFLVIFCFR